MNVATTVHDMGYHILLDKDSQITTEISTHSIYTCKIKGKNTVPVLVYIKPVTSKSGSYILMHAAI